MKTGVTNEEDILKMDRDMSHLGDGKRLVEIMVGPK